MLRQILTVICCVVLFHGVSAGEPTVAEKDKLRTIAQIQKNFEETLKAVPTTVSGQALLPDGSPAVGFKIGGWGRSLTNRGYGHFLFDTVTDQQGRFSLSLYRPSEYWITIDDPNHVYVAPDRYLELKEPLDGGIAFQLQQGIPVEGVVMDRERNEPIAGLPLWLNCPQDYRKDLTLEERLDREKRDRTPRELKTDEQGKFRCAVLPQEYFLTFDDMFALEKPTEEEAALYTRTFTAEKAPIRFQFHIPTPWFGTLLQKDGSPAADYPVFMSIRFWNGTASKEVVTDKNGRFMVYRPIQLNTLEVYTFEENQWFYKNFEGEKLPSDPVFELYSPLMATGRLVRKSTGEPLRNFKFLCLPSLDEVFTTDGNGDFEIRGIYLGRKTSLGFVNPPDDDSCSISADFKTFTPTIPDRKIELGTVELEESGRLESGTLENLPGKIVEIEGVTLDGQVFDWKKYRGKVVLVEFWATWCGPCLKEIPHLKAVYEKYRDRGFEIVGISVDEDLKDLEKGLARHEFPWPVLADQKWKDAGNLRMYDRFAVRGVPRGILVDRNGKVVTIETRGEKLDTELKKLFPDSLDEATTYEEIRSYIEHVFTESRKNLKTTEDQEHFLETYPPVGIAGGRKIIALNGDDESLEEGYGILLAALGWSLKKHPENTGEIESLMGELNRLEKFPDLANDARFYLFYHRSRLFDAEKSPRTEFEFLKEEAKKLAVLKPTNHSNLDPMETVLETAQKISLVENNPRFLEETLEDLVQWIITGPFEKKELGEKYLRGFRRRMVGSPFDLWGKTVDGKDFDWADYKGKVVLVDFTASWCGPCRAEMPNIVEMYDQYHRQGLEVVCVGYEDKTDDLKKMMKEDGVSFVVISENLSKGDPRGLPSDYYGIFGIPEIFLVGRDARIIATSLRGPELRDSVAKQFADKENPVK